MTLKEAITLDNFKTLWSVPNGNNLNDLAQYFYEKYGDDELIMPATKLEVHWKLFVWPTINSLNYEYKRWTLLNAINELKDTSIISGTNNGTTTNSVTSNQSQTNNSTNNDTTTINASKSDGYGGYTIQNQLGKYKTQNDNSTSTSTSVNELTGRIEGTSQNSGTQNNTINSNTTNTHLNDIRTWLSTNFEDITRKYITKIVNIIFIPIW